MTFIITFLFALLFYAFVGGTAIFILLNLLLPVLGLACISFKVCALIAIALGIIKMLF